MLTAFDSPAGLAFWCIAGARFLLPLTIPKYPLPGILASLILDAVDQTIFQQFPSLNLEGYQGYDKALDIYYLSVAYISTLRNWQNHFAFQISRFLFYWRLVGVALFELSQLRALLLIFPNTFEYFFIFYETYRLRWDPRRMPKKHAIAAAAFIWIVIKLPQEYWIHISQTDTTDWIKTNLLHLPVETPWSEILLTGFWLVLALLAVTVFILFAIWQFLRRRLPPPDRTLAFSADAHKSGFSTEEVRKAVAMEAERVVDSALLEKICLITLVSLCFAQVLPDVYSTDLQLTVAVSLVVVINTVLSHWLARWGYGWAFTSGQFILLAVVNFGLILTYAIVRSFFGDPVRILNVLFFAILLSMLITLYDRYRQVYLMRFGSSSGGG